MTERNPIPYCLAHLTQLGAAVRARALELPDNVSAASDLLSDFILQCEGSHDDESDARAAFRIIDRHLRQIPTPPAAAPPPRLSVVRSTPRAELIAEYRRLVDVCDDLIRGTDDPGAEALAAIYCSRLVLGRAEAIPDEAPSHPPTTTAIRAIIERARQHLVAGSSHAFIMVRAAEAEAAQQEIAAIERTTGGGA